MIKLPKNLYMYFFSQFIAGERREAACIKIGNWRCVKGITNIFGFSYNEALSYVTNENIGTIKYLVIQPKYQEAFCFAYPALIPYIKDLKPEIKAKITHVELANKFGLFENASS